MGLLDFLKNIAENVKTNSETITSIKKDFATVIMLSNYGHGNPLPNEYPLYFEKEYGISDPKSFHLQLIEDGFLGPASNADMLSQLTVEELKDTLSSYGLPKSGTKKILISRILENIDDTSLSIISTRKNCYSLTQKGQEFLSSKEDYVYLHKHSSWAIPLEEYIKLRSSFDSNQFHQAILTILKKRLSSSMKPLDIRTSSFHLSQLLFDMNQKNDSLYYLLTVLYIDVNSLENYPPLELYRQKLITKKKLIERYPLNVFYPEVLKSLSKLKDCYTPSLVDKVYRNRPISAKFCNQKTFEKLLADLFLDSEHSIIQWNKYFEESFYKKIDFL